eukprot:2619287-Pleurochrysis_carterae.AAC.3
MSCAQNGKPLPLQASLNGPLEKVLSMQSHSVAARSEDEERGSEKERLGYLSRFPLAEVHPYSTLVS